MAPSVHLGLSSTVLCSRKIAVAVDRVAAHAKSAQDLHAADLSVKTKMRSPAETICRPILGSAIRIQEVLAITSLGNETLRARDLAGRLWSGRLTGHEAREPGSTDKKSF